MRNRLRAALALLLLASLLLGASSFAEENTALWEQAAAALLSPKAEGMSTMSYALHTGESAYVPSIAPEIIPFDEQGAAVLPTVNGSFESADEAIVTVDETGLMTAIAQGQTTVTYHAASGDEAYAITVSDDVPREKAKAVAYVALREFYATQRARLPKYNKYAKWYYGKKKEVGWCSVFTIWCANAGGNDPVKEKAAGDVPADQVIYFREGQVGNQYDGFQKLNRFVDVPRVGYLVIYADMSKGYRTTHIGIVVDVQDRGDGLYAVRTVEGNMSNSVKSYCYLYDSSKANNTVGVEKGRKLQNNMSELPGDEQTDPLIQYKLHTDHWSVFGFGATW